MTSQPSVAAHASPAPTRIGTATFTWGERTYVMGIVNVTPDSFSGDGLLAGGLDPIEAAVEPGGRWRPMVPTCSTSAANERDRVTPSSPWMMSWPASFLSSPRFGGAAGPSVEHRHHQGPGRGGGPDAGADLLNDVWGVGPDDALSRLAAKRGVPLVVMHNRAEPRYEDLVTEVVADLRRALDRAVRCARRRARCPPGRRWRGRARAPAARGASAARAGRCPRRSAC